MHFFFHKSVTNTENSCTVFGEKVKKGSFQMNMNQLDNKCFLNYTFAWISSDSMITHDYIPKVGLLSLNCTFYKYYMIIIYIFGTKIDNFDAKYALLILDN